MGLFPPGDNNVGPANVGLGPGGQDFSTGYVTNNSGIRNTLANWISAGFAGYLPLTGGALSGSLAISSGSLLVADGSVTFGQGDLTVADGAAFINGALHSTGTLSVDGDAQIVGNGTFDGNLTIGGGSLTVNNTGSVVLNSGPLIVNGGSILLSSGTLTVEGCVDITAGPLVLGSTTLAVPNAGMVVSTGTNFESAVLVGLTLSGGNTLTASSAGSVTQVAAGAGLTTTYGSTGGTISVTGTLTNTTPTNSQSGSTYAITDSDNGKLLNFTDASAANVAVTLPQAGASSLFLAGWSAYVLSGNNTANNSNETVTITPTTSTINAMPRLVLGAGQGALIVSDGTNYQAVVGSPVITLPNGAVSIGFYGNARGNNALDLQSERLTVAHVSSGNQSTVVGMVSTASGQGSFAGGYQVQSLAQFAVSLGANIISNDVGAIGIGNDLTSQGANSINVGGTNDVEGDFGIGIGSNISGSVGSGTTAIGRYITGNGTNTQLLGYQITDRGNYGAFIHSGVNLQGTTSNLGRSQLEEYVLVNQTTGSTAVRLTADGNSAGALNVGALGSAGVAQFTIDLTITDTATGAIVTYTLGPSLIARPTSQASTVMGTGNPSFVAGPTVGSLGALGAAPTVTADTSNGGFNLSYTPPSGNTDALYAVARLRYLTTRYN